MCRNAMTLRLMEQETTRRMGAQATARFEAGQSATTLPGFRAAMTAVLQEWRDKGIVDSEYIAWLRTTAAERANQPYPFDTNN
ncbi:hypothetical protein KJ782_07125 [Patescibacteria group bacterium]|nr:hypothetical protein [Patescibacteria group bacterium]